MATTTLYANKDSIIGETQYGSGADQHLPIGYNSWLPGDSRIYVGYGYSFTGWTGITSAVAYFRTSDGNNHIGSANWNDPDVYIDLVTSSWSEGTAGETWLSTNAIRWNAGLPSVSVTNRVSWDVGGGSDPSINTWYSVDITALMQQAFASGVFYGLRVMAQVEGSGGDRVEFVSREGGYAPYIVVTYSTNTAPNAPTNLSPTGDAIVNDLTPNLSGTFSDPNAGDTMSGVEIEVRSDDLATAYWLPGMVTVSGTSFSRTYAGSALVGNAFYKWRARTKDAAGAVGAWSAYQRFKANSVPNGASLSVAGSASDQTTLTPTIYVTHNDPDPSDSQMTAYHVIVTRSSDGATMWDTGDVTVTATTTTTLTYAGSALAWGTQYAITARTKDANGAWGAYSSAFYITTHATAAPTSLAPSGGNIAPSLTPTFTGSRGSTNDSLTALEIEVYESDGTTLKWSSGSSGTGVTSSSFSRVYAGAALTATSTYKWRARVTSSVGGVGPWSAQQTFVAPDPNAPVQTSPAATGVSLTPTFTFTRGVNFNRHQAYLYSDAAGANLLWSDTPTAYTATGSKSVVYPGTPALSYATTYYWKVRVSADGGSTWSPYAGLTAFATDAAGVAQLTLPADNSWQTTLTPTFTGSTQNSETISTFRIIVYADDQTTVVWDSGDLAGSGTSFSKVYNGSTALVKGRKYYWKASYVKTGGAPGGYSPLRSFHINADPGAPTNREPISGAVVADTLTPAYKASFADDDMATWGDTPTVYDVEVRRNSDDVLMHSLTKNTGLVAGQNSVARTVEGTALSYEVEYKWRARYTDSKTAAGTWSNYNVFKPSQSPTLAITAPSSGSNLTSPAFTVTWTMTSAGGKAQGQYRVRILRHSDAYAAYDSGIVTTSVQSCSIPTGRLVNLTDYDIEVSTWDTDGLASPVVSQTNTANWTAPTAPANFQVVADDETSWANLTWTATTLGSGASGFSQYTIYRRVVGDAGWETLAVISTETTHSYSDFYAAVGVTYDYRITVWKKVPGDADLESPDSNIASAVLDSDAWYVIGHDRSEEHSFELPVYDSPYSEPVQQESFEPLGRNRKTISRGKALGAEGNLKVTFLDTERALAVRQVEYIRTNAGPHILKSPFGDIWEVEFSGPQKAPRPGGHLDVTLVWTEVE